MVVDRFTIPFISISAKKVTWKGKACMTNQYLPVSSSQITTEVTKTMATSAGERSEARPPRKRSVKERACGRKRSGANRSLNQPAKRAAWAGKAAMTRKATTAPMNAAAPHSARVRMSPIKPEAEVSRANSGRLRKTNPSITTPSKALSTMMVASEAEIGTPSCRRST